ncbi:hypothetical protein [Streptomyces nodosus]|uniref:hypothetical protein n=1 Tax=Streptomyces nodosus TaxID=40318 RepID=UPI003821B429
MGGRPGAEAAWAEAGGGHDEGGGPGFGDAAFVVTGYRLDQYQWWVDQKFHAAAGLP